MLANDQLDCEIVDINGLTYRVIHPRAKHAPVQVRRRSPTGDRYIWCEVAASFSLVWRNARALGKLMRDIREGVERP